MTKLTYLIPLLPLIGFLINGLGRRSLSKQLTAIIGCGTILGSFILSLLLFLVVNTPGFNATEVKYFDFINTAGINIPFAFRVDQLSILFLLIVIDSQHLKTFALDQEINCVRVVQETFFVAILHDKKKLI
jgi:NADH-quinone oxidoreductase subunit L